MPSLKSLGSRDRIRTVKIEPVEGWEVELTYRPGLVTVSTDIPDDNDPDSPSILARRFCGYVMDDGTQFPGLIVDWDVTGPLYHTYTGMELVPDGEPVPLEANIVQNIELEALAGFNQELARVSTPKLKTRKR